MDKSPHTDLAELRKRVASGEYQPDPRTVADAIMLRARAHAVALQSGPVVPIAPHRSNHAPWSGARKEEHARAA